MTRASINRTRANITEMTKAQKTEGLPTTKGIRSSVAKAVTIVRIRLSLKLI